MQDVQIDISLIPAVDKQVMSATFLSAVQIFYSNPQNIEKFEEWKRQRSGKKENGGKNNV